MDLKIHLNLIRMVLKLSVPPALPSGKSNLYFDTRVTTGEKEVSKVRADAFFRLKEGEVITYADGRDQQVHFSLQRIQKHLPESRSFTAMELEGNFDKIYKEAKSIFGSE